MRAVVIGSKVLDIDTSTSGTVAELAYAPSGNLWLRVRLADGREVVAHREAFAVLPEPANDAAKAKGE